MEKVAWQKNASLLALKKKKPCVISYTGLLEVTSGFEPL